MAHCRMVLRLIRLIMPACARNDAPVHRGKSPVHRNGVARGRSPPYVRCMGGRSMQTILAAILMTLAFAMQACPEEVRGKMAEVLRYAGVENATLADSSRMADLWVKAQQPALSRDERRAAFRDLHQLYLKLQGRDLS